MMIRKTTLFEIMQPFDASRFLSIASALAFLSGSDRALDHNTSVGQGGGILSAKYKQAYIGHFQTLEQECIRLNLRISAEFIQSLIEKLAEPTVTHAELGKQSDEIWRLLIVEMKSVVFFSIEPNKQQWLSEEGLFGDAVAEAFPSAANDIKNAARCLAFERWTASVFHSMRVLEIGLNVLARTLEVPDQANWQALIKNINDKVEGMSKKATKEERNTTLKFYSDAVSQFRWFKDAWRNHAIHGRETYEEERAESIFRHVKDFMVQLATELKEDRA